MTDANDSRTEPDAQRGANPYAKEILGERSRASTSTAAGASSRPSRAAPRRVPFNAIALWIALLLLVGAALAGAYLLNQRFERALGALGERTTRSDAALADTRAKSEQALAASRQLDGQVAALSGRLGDAQTQQQALEQLYQDLARNRDDWVMTDAEQTLSTANQQLQLTGNVQLALFALQNADAQLASTDGPQVLVIRRAIAADTDKLKALPVIDVPGLALRLDQAIAQIDSLPLTGDVPAAAANAGAAAGDATPGASASGVRASPLTGLFWKQWWLRVSHGFGASASHLIQVRRIDPGSADAMLVAPAQAQYLRENVKLRLLSARLSLLARDEKTLRADLAAADDALARYFDSSSRAIGVVRGTIADIQRTAQQVTVPTLDASLQALRQYKSRG
ncbi:uroporphyrinogen-III C-methyltransferase [Robbsia sp. Bb-Pol-6]|uniref:Uroporphyrinogen-III C-methyltransferase n=1 Tax=Robbsia betulipollinis TaxID=2981849 RepID=A0ABT3ZLN8_9BURK|nr:uroporphyrinogen-III C-methyltransferase [Robbsia betulipollinis]MCY0387461.1 uroporphyrinogen-III C-methyltransferase [Robbsia betulipollinis]